MAKRGLDKSLAFIPRRLAWWSIPFVKVAAFCFGLLVLYVVPAFTGISWGVWFISFLVLAAVPLLEARRTLASIASGNVSRKMKKSVTLSFAGLVFLILSVIAFAFMIATAFPRFTHLEYTIPLMVLVIFSVPPVLDYFNKI